MFAFPLFDTFDGQQEIGRLFHVGSYVDHTGRANELAWWDGIRCIVGQVFAGDPVDWRVEVCTGMLAQVHHVPVPGRPAAVVVRNLGERQTRRWRGYRRQVDDWRI